MVRCRGGENRQALLDEILAIVLDPAVGDEQVGGLLRTRVGLERLRQRGLPGRGDCARSGHLALMDASMTYLRQFTPAVLAALRFAGGPGTEQLLRGVSMLAELYATGARKVPARAAVRFVPTKWGSGAATARGL